MAKSRNTAVKTIFAEKEPVVRNGKIRVNNPRHNRPMLITLWVIFLMGVVAFIYMGFNFEQIFRGMGKVPHALRQISQFDLGDLDVTLLALFETLDVAILATVYSIFLGFLLGALMAKNINPVKWIRVVLSAFTTFVRGIPDIIWVLLFIGSLGMGIDSGIIGVIIGSAAFFARVFAQLFEEVDEETIEALQATGASRLKIFFAAIIPASFTGIIAWVAVNLENNYGGASILGTVGAGGIGYIISANFGRYKYGRAIVGILVMFAVAFALEMYATRTKEKMRIR